MDSPEATGNQYAPEQLYGTQLLLENHRNPDGSRMSVLLEDEKITKGGEGEIIGIKDNSQYIVKLWFHPNDPKGGYIERTKAMLTKRPRIVDAQGITIVDPIDEDDGLPTFAWPIDLLRSPQRGVVGYLMQNVKAEDDIALIHLMNRRMRLNKILEFSNNGEFDVNDFTFDNLLQYAEKLARMFDTYNTSTGNVFGDVQHNNIIASLRGGIHSIDNESGQIRVRNKQGETIKILRSSGVALEEYRPPELIDHSRKDYKNINDPDVLREPKEDVYGLQLMITELLLGIKLNMDIETDQNGEKRILSLPPHLVKIDGMFNKYGQPLYTFANNGNTSAASTSIPIAALGPYLAKLMRQGHIDGYENSFKRPWAKNWANAIKQTRELLVYAPCGKDNHVIVKDTNIDGCVFCKTESQGPAGKYFN